MNLGSMSVLFTVVPRVGTVLGTQEGLSNR